MAGADRELEVGLAPESLLQYQVKRGHHSRNKRNKEGRRGSKSSPMPVGLHSADYAGPDDRPRVELARDFSATRAAGRRRGAPPGGGSAKALGSPLAARAAISSAGPVLAP